MGNNWQYYFKTLLVIIATCMYCLKQKRAHDQVICLFVTCSTGVIRTRIHLIHCSCVCLYLHHPVDQFNGSNSSTITHFCEVGRK